MADRRSGLVSSEPAAAGRGLPALPPAEAPEQAYERVRRAREIRRPHALELLQLMAREVLELHGDRLFGDDGAIVGGFARLDGRPIVFVGQQKGGDTDENIRRNFGSAHPEGFRKAIRLFRLAERLGLPVVTLVDTAGAHPGPESEARGIAEAIARSILTMVRLRTPIVVAIIGEGGSGGALAVAAGDVVLALENAVYAVISPEGCASILWRSADAAAQAAAAMRITAAQQRALGVVDLVIAEPDGGAHTDPRATARNLAAAIGAQLDRLALVPLDELVEARYRRYRAMGAYAVAEEAPAGPRPERMTVSDRLRTLFETGRIALGSPEQAPLRPQAADDFDEPPLREDL